MKNDLLKIKKNIISWYPIEKNAKVLQIGKDEEINKELLKKTSNVAILENISEFEIKAKFDYVILIGCFERIKTREEITKLITFADSMLERDGKILLAMKNKFGMKYFAGEKVDASSDIFEPVVSKKDNMIGLKKIKNILDSLKLKYKFYYPLPDYDVTNVIYTDEYLPTNDSLDARDLTFCQDGSVIVFSEREAFKQILKEDSEMFPFFSNSYFIEISHKDKFQDIRYVGYGITRKEKYRIKTIMKKDEVIKTYDNDLSKEHIKNIGKNIDILNNCKIECLDKYENEVVTSKILHGSKSYDEYIMEEYNRNGINSVIENIKVFKENILDKLLKNQISDLSNTVFEKYHISLSNEKKNKLHFIKNGVLDLIFQNALIKGNKIYIYDQEWYEENVPLEFILYRALFYFTELKKIEDIEELYKIFELNDYEKEFNELETLIQKEIVDEEMWNRHVKSTENLGGSNNFVDSFEKKLDAANTHIKNLESNIEEYKKGNDNLNSLVKQKDTELVNYADQLRAISNSVSWKITKPIRSISNALRGKKK